MEAGAAAAGCPAAGVAVVFEAVEEGGFASFRQADNAIDATIISARNFVISNLGSPKGLRDIRPWQPECLRDVFRS